MTVPIGGCHSCFCRFCFPIHNGCVGIGSGREILSIHSPGGGSVAPGLWAYNTAVFFQIYPKFRENRRIFLKDSDFWAAAHKPSSMPKISRFFGYWRKKHRFMPKSAIYTPYRYVQNKLSSLAACLPLSPSPGAGRQLLQSSLETAWSCTQHPVCIPIREGFFHIVIKASIFKGFSGDGGFEPTPGNSRQTHFECTPALRPLRYVSVYLWNRRPGGSRPLFPIIHDISSLCSGKSIFFHFLFCSSPEIRIHGRRDPGHQLILVAFVLKPPVLVGIA